MPDISVLIKPSSSACNMQCDYCFYMDEAENRQDAFTGFLSPEKAELVIKRAVEFSDKNINFMFQGGEPTLAGIDFFRNFLLLENKYKTPNITFYNSIQTNGYGLDENWAKFLADNSFLVGLSLDGPSDIHNYHRKDKNQKDTFNSVMNTVRLFNKYNVEYNILCVINGQNVSKIEKIYNFFKKQNFGYIQFIPCLEPLNEKRGMSSFALTPEAYGIFLTKIFRLWFNDLKKGSYISIRHIDNYLRLAKGLPAECCSMNGRCSIQFVVEGNGKVYPCDFYVLDEYCIGDITSESFANMAQSNNAQSFIQSSFAFTDACKKCKYISICRNGCRRDRLNDNSNYYCSSYKKFFSECENELVAASNYLIK